MQIACFIAYCGKGIYCILTHISCTITYISYIQVGSLLDTLQVLPYAKLLGDLRMFSTLIIAHTKHAGEQRVACWPFKQSSYRRPHTGALANTHTLRPKAISLDTIRSHHVPVLAGKVLDSPNLIPLEGFLPQLP